MRKIVAQDECNDTYGRRRMYQALLLRQLDCTYLRSERTVYRIMKKIGLSHRPKHKPNGITKADREAHKLDNLPKRDFKSEEPLKKCVTDITQIKAKDGELYVSAIFDCFDSAVLGLSMDTNMKATLCQQALTNAVRSYPALLGAIVHSDISTQAKFTAKLLPNMVYSKVLTVMAAGVTTMLAVKVCGLVRKRSFFTDDTIPGN